MPGLPHLPLVWVNIQQPRRRKPGFSGAPRRDYHTHGPALAQELSTTLDQYRHRTPPQGIRPELILRVTTAVPIPEDGWRRVGLSLVGQDDEKTLVLFASDAEMTAFRDRLAAYSGGPAEGRRNAPYAGMLNAIERVGSIEPQDRIGRLFRQQGIERPDQFTNDTTYTVDLELWHAGNQQECRSRINEIKAYLATQGARMTDDYVGPDLVLARVKARGSVMQTLLNLDTVAVIDLPPKVSLRVANQLQTSLQDLGPVAAPPDNAPGICIIDSGITAAHPLLGPAVGEATVGSPTLTTAQDENGHGTRVAGLALYGDISACISQNRFIPALRLYSSRVLNAANEFDDELLITTQMRNAIEYFKNEYQCRVFNVSIGDPRQPFTGAKVSPWASILDNLARENDIVIIVSAGNYEHEPDVENPNDHRTGYPDYLLKPPASIIEPATGAIVLTVGSLAESASLPQSTASTVTQQPIAQPGQPSPFTRSGPGAYQSIKPEVCEYGGNLSAELLTHTTRPYDELSIVSLNKDYIQRLFCTGYGTSFAAPKVSHLAARLVGALTTTTSTPSANLLRALIASSARVPTASEELLQEPPKVLRLCGYGVPAFDRASTSDQNRAVLIDQREIPLDQIHLYAVPIPAEFYAGSGERRITVTLAFDPPVRHSRLDYLGTTMSFRLIRGKTEEEVVAAFRSQQGGVRVDRISGSANCNLQPGPNAREGGTLQKATFTMRRGDASYGDMYYLVVRCERRWTPGDDAMQRYAVVVTVEHEQTVELYNRIRERVEQRSRARV